jgi:AcrR family transcriptional regulator
MTQRKAAGDRRAEIQRAALTLFTVHGYEATSMREIAEQLDITKAALYYHFDSKEAIIRSLFEGMTTKLDDLVEWAEGQPYSEERSAKISAGWFDLIAAEGLPFARFATTNQAALRDLAPKRGGLMDALARLSVLLVEPGTPPAELLKIRMAMLSVNLVVMSSPGLDLTDEEILTTAAETATLISPHFSVTRSGRGSE